MKISNSLKFVVFVVIFAFVFILILNLQGSEKFAAIKTKDIFAAHAAIVSAIGLIVLLISRIALNIVYKKNDSETITYGTYIIWIVAEIVAISLFCKGQLRTCNLSCPYVVSCDSYWVIWSNKD